MQDQIEKAYNDYLEVKGKYDEATEEYKKIENKIYAAGALISYYKNVSEDYDNAYNVLNKSVEIVDKRFVYKDIEDSVEQIKELQKKCNDNYKKTESIISTTTTIFKELNDKLEEQHKLVEELNTEKELAYARYSTLVANGY